MPRRSPTAWTASRRAPRSFAKGSSRSFPSPIDAMYPMSALTESVGSFRSVFPYTPLRLYVEVLGAVIEPVLQGTCHIGVIGTFPVVPDSLRSEPLLDVRMVTVAAPG